MPIILVNDGIGRIWRQPDIIRMRHRILLAIRHAQRKRDTALDGGFNLLTRHIRTSFLETDRSARSFQLLVGSSASLLSLWSPDIENTQDEYNKCSAAR